MTYSIQGTFRWHGERLPGRLRQASKRTMQRMLPVGLIACATGTAEHATENGTPQLRPRAQLLLCEAAMVTTLSIVETIPQLRLVRLALQTT